MKKLVFLLALPLALLAWVEVDTIVPLGSEMIFGGHYLPEFNKLYIRTRNHILALNCSTWRVTAEFPTDGGGKVQFAWNPIRKKLYVGFNHPRDSTLVIYPEADTARWIFTGFWNALAYVGSEDLLYGNPRWHVSEEVWALDCAADTVVKVIRLPREHPRHAAGAISYDSSMDRVYVNMAVWEAPSYIAVYDVKTDSLLALINPGMAPSMLNFHHEARKAYVVSRPPPRGGGAAVINTEGLRLIRSFPFSTAGDDFGPGPVAINTLMDKVYIAGNRVGRNCTLFVVDAKTDNIIKEVEYRGTGSRHWLVWVPWSNRVYLAADYWSHMAVLDCATDSIIVPRLVLTGQHWTPMNLQLDPIRERIFAIGADTNAIHVLRDLPYGVEEGREPIADMQKPIPTIVRGVLNLPAAGMNNDQIPMTMLDISGRKVMDLAPGDNYIRHLAPGVYFVRQASGMKRDASTVQKVVIQR